MKNDNKPYKPWVSVLPGSFRDKFVKVLAGEASQPSRAAQIAATAGKRLEELGQLPDQNTTQVPETDTPEAQQKRRELRQKLKAFWD